MPGSPLHGARRTAALSTTLAAVLAGALTLTAPPPAFAASLLLNGDFEQVAANGLPEGWGVWKPAGNGTATVVDGAGPDGSRALKLEGDTPDDRVAVSRRLTNPDPSRDRYFRVSFDERAEDVGGTWASVRVQYVGGNKPLTMVGSTSGTHGWRRVEAYVSAPAGTTELSVEPMLDSAKGRLFVDNLVVEPVDADGVAAANPQPTGEIELAWRFDGLAVARYEIHRSTDPGFTPSPATRIRTLPDITGAEDATTVPGGTYTYKVVALAADGTPLGTTTPATATAVPVFEDQQRTDVLTATRTGDGVRVAWRLAAGGTGPVTVYAGRQKVGTYDIADGGVTLAPGGYRENTTFSVVRNGRAIATARLADLQHPRFGATEDKLAKVRRLIAKPGSPQEIWKQLLQRVGSDGAAYSYNFGEAEGRWAAEAALAHQVTQDPAHARTAYTAFTRAEARLSLLTGQALETGNATTYLAEAYDWAYNGWTEAQRADARRILQRLAAAFEVLHAPNIDLPDKASNWVSVVRGSELALWLAVRGDGGFDLGERRIPGLVDQMRRHLDGAYGDTGWDQEGLDYLSYGLTIGAPGVMGAADAGITALEDSWHRPHFANLIMHSLSSQTDSARLQWGVGSPTGGLAAAPLFFDTVPEEQQAAWLWHYEHTVGAYSPGRGYSGSQSGWALLNWPEHVEPRDPDHGPASVRRALLDDHDGAYQFRSRYQDGDDVLVGVTNRNNAHIGWNGLETFGLTLIGHEATWARQPAKEYATRPELFSKPLIDGRPEHRGNTGDRSPGRGRTLASRSYDGQGGGFLSLDGSGNYEVSKARRDIAVDLRPVAGADSVVALHDSFSDTASHRYDWQLAPEAGTEITFGGTESGAKTFLFRKGDGYLKGWLLNPEGAELSVEKGAFKVTRTGPEADFRVVLAFGEGTPPTATTDGTTLTLGNTTYDLANLKGHRPGAH
ncbi:hypothetical protein [Streptomyces sp. NPDC050848]|uniref:hypothetical protein n=1 Tax=Streptomyces sp. NPDC050848 TaxID=3155791 RepID=UPI0033D0E0BA